MHRGLVCSWAGLVVEPGAGVVAGMVVEHIANASTALLSSVLDCGENAVGAGSVCVGGKVCVY